MTVLNIAHVDAQLPLLTDVMLTKVLENIIAKGLTNGDVSAETQ